MAHSVAPALVSSPDQLIEFKVADGTPADAGKEIGFSERYIHSEIYKQFAGANCVVHSHSADVLPYTVSTTPLKPIIHTAAFLGNNVPVWDVSRAYGSYGSGSHDLLVRDTKLGHSLAMSMDKTATSTGFIYSKLSSTIKGATGGKGPEAASHLPDYPVCLMRGHGFATAGSGIEEAVYMAVYTREAANALTTALSIGRATADAQVEGNVDVQGSGKIKGGKVKLADTVSYLSDREMKDGWETIKGSVMRPWKLWCREVEVNPLYVNEAKKEG